MEDFRRPDGSIDWEAMHVAERRTGGRCQDCDSLILWPDPKIGKCIDCRGFDEPGETWHPQLVRCPHCGDRRVPSCDDGRFYAEGTHDLWCNECDREFEIETAVSYEFKSPERVR